MGNDLGQIGVVDPVDAGALAAAIARARLVALLACPIVPLAVWAFPVFFVGSAAGPVSAWPLWLRAGGFVVLQSGVSIAAVVAALRLRPLERGACPLGRPAWRPVLLKGTLGLCASTFGIPPLLDGAAEAWRAHLLNFKGVPNAQVIERLGAADPAVRWGAAEEIGRRRLPAGTRPLLALLESETTGDRAAGIRALGAIGRRAQTAEPVLLRHHGTEPDPRVRCLIIEALPAVSDGPLVATFLVRSLDDADLQARKSAAQGLSGLGAVAVPALFADPDHGDAWQRNDPPTLLADLLRPGGSGAAAVRRELRRILADEPAGPRARALAVVGTALFFDPATASLCTACADDPDPAVRWRAVTVAQASLGRQADRDLDDALRAGCDDVCRQLVQGTGCEAQLALRALDPVVKALGDERVRIAPKLAAALRVQRHDRPLVLDALLKLGRGADVAVPALVAIVNGPLERQRPVRWPSGSDQALALQVLGAIGPGARAALPDLVRALVRPDLREDAALAIGRIGPDAAAVEALIALVRDHPSRTRSDVARVRPTGGSSASGDWESATTSGTPEGPVRAAGARGLAEAGSAALQAVPALIAALEDIDPIVRREIATDLLLISRSPECVEAAVSALRRNLFETGDWGIRSRAALALGAMGQDAAAAAPDLESLAADRAQPAALRDVAAAALERVRGQEPRGTRAPRRRRNR